MTEGGIEIKTQEVQEILGRPPKWIIRWGISLIFIVIAGIIIGSYFFKYPEIITAPVVITVKNTHPDTTQIIGSIYLQSQFISKVRERQDVKLKFDLYPFMEYGSVKAKITSIPIVPIMQNNIRIYVLEIEVPKRLITNYGKELRLNQEMHGVAAIVTEELRVLDRFLKPIKALVKR